MAIWQAIVLGAVQGLAEFLPISSSGHLLLLQRWFSVTEGGLFFDVVLHLATLVPVCTVFYKRIVGILKKPYDKLLFLIIATIPAGITGVALGSVIEQTFYSVSLLSACLLALTFVLTAVELFIAEIVVKKYKRRLPLKIHGALVMGLAQGIAVMPGLSRSGTVLSAGAFMGINNDDNATFTFLMSIPVILGAGLVSGYKAIKSGVFVAEMVLPTLFGAITAAVTGYIAVSFMLRIIKKSNYKWFGIYLLLLAVCSVLSYVFMGV